MYDPRAPTPPTPTHEQFGAPAAGSIPTIIRSFKSSVTQRARWARIDGPVWQRNYYERVIRNECELDAVRLYIQDNPRQWGEDGENPGR